MDIPNRTVGSAKYLRRTMTLPEVRLWLVLRERPDGLKFRRQHPIGGYVLDFYCHAARLCVEIDGEAHNTASRALADQVRDAWLAEQGITTLRFPAVDVLRRLNEVQDAIVRIAAAAPSVRCAATFP